MTTRRRLAGIRENVPLEQASAYHAAVREATLEAFGRAYEHAHEHAPARDLPAPATDEPGYVVASSADGELLVIAGVWPAAGRTCGRLVAPRELLALLLEDPTTTAVWCDEDNGAGLALTAYAVTVGVDPLHLIVARSARVVGETAGVTDVEYEEARLVEGAWAVDALDTLLGEHDGDAVVLPPWMLTELAGHVADVDLH